MSRILAKVLIRKEQRKARKANPENLLPEEGHGKIQSVQWEWKAF
jgi:hypothetical protein